MKNVLTPHLISVRKSWRHLSLYLISIMCNVDEYVASLHLTGVDRLGEKKACYRREEERLYLPAASLPYLHCSVTEKKEEILPHLPHRTSPPTYLFPRKKKKKVFKRSTAFLEENLPPLPGKWDVRDARNHSLHTSLPAESFRRHSLLFELSDP